MVVFVFLWRLETIVDLPCLVVEQIEFWIFGECQEKVGFFDKCERVNLVKDASFIEKLAQLGYFKGVWIYPQNEKTFVGSDSEYIFLTCSLEVVNMGFLFEWFNSVKDKCGLLLFHVFNIEDINATLFLTNQEGLTSQVKWSNASYIEVKIAFSYLLWRQ